MEFMVGLVAVLAIFAALIQITSLSLAHIETLIEARREAGERAVLSIRLYDTPETIRDWETGPDERRYSRDDTWLGGNAYGFSAVIVDKAVERPSDWSLVEEAPRDPLTALRSAGNPAAHFGLVRGRAARTVPLMGAVRNLLYDADSIDVESDVWMTRIGGIY